jgi:hypothetical protein
MQRLGKVFGYAKVCGRSSYCRWGNHSDASFPVVTVMPLECGGSTPLWFFLSRAVMIRSV